MLSPKQYGPVLEADTWGNGLTTTVVSAVFLQPLLSVTSTVYLPALAKVEAKAVGSSILEVNPSGPVQLQLEALVLVPLAVKVAFNCMLSPKQYGPVLVADTWGNGLTIVGYSQSTLPNWEVIESLTL